MDDFPVKTTGIQRIADRYVTALMDGSTQARATEAVENDMNTLTRALAESAELRHFLGNPLLPRKAQASALAALAEKMKLSPTTRQFLALLAERGRLELLPAAAKAFIRRAGEARGEVAAEVVSATPLSEKETQRIAQELSRACGKNVTVTVSQDADLLGGVVVKMGSLQLDSSLAGKLRRMRRTLLAA